MSQNRGHFVQAWVPVPKYIKPTMNTIVVVNGDLPYYEKHQAMNQSQYHVLSNNTIILHGDIRCWKQCSRESNVFKRTYGFVAYLHPKQHFALLHCGLNNRVDITSDDISKCLCWKEIF